MIRLKDITVVVGKNTALEKVVLDNINLEIGRGDFITLIGGNGAGKSTLLKLIAGEITPTKGEIYIDDKEISRLSVEERAKYIGYVYQDPLVGTCEALTVEENLALANSRGKRRGLSLALNHRNRLLFKDLLTRSQLGLERRLSDQVASLSGGQRQMLSLVMATLQTPKILLLDEHTAALDPKMAKTVLSMTQEMVSQHHLATIMITHHMMHALEMGNRTLLMNEGKIVQDLTQGQRQLLKPADLISYF